MGRTFEEIEHTADLAIRVYGRDLKELFANAAYGMFSLMADLESLTPTTSRQVQLEASDYEALLVDWLNELLYLHEVEDEVYIRFEVSVLTPTELRATIAGAGSEASKIAIKAATFHDLVVVEIRTGYTATVVFDV